MMSGLKFTPDSFDGAVDSWQAGIKECGEYVGHGDYTFEAKDDELTVSVPTRSSKIVMLRLNLCLIKNLYLESMTVSAKFSLGEIMEKAGLNTLLGMGTVFAVLIFISFLISLFKYIPAIQNAFGKKKDEQKEEARKRLLRQHQLQKWMTTDDAGSLIAVISAAIAAAEGTTTDGFVVRSIKRRPSNKWNSSE